MNFATSEKNRQRSPRSRQQAAGFTLAEVLAAMLFMAIVIPVAIQGLRVASLAGEVAERKARAARIAERVLNESIVMSNWIQSASGTVVEGVREFRWSTRSEQWSQHLTNQLSASASAMNQLAGSQPAVNQLAMSQVTMNLLSVEVLYRVQNQDYSLRLSTLMNPQQ